MKILGIETSCDETAAAVVEDGRKICSNVVVSQIDIFQAYGGVIPEVAARSHLEAILPVVDQALRGADARIDSQKIGESGNLTVKDQEKDLTPKDVNWGEIDAIAVTHAPGLLGSLLIGTLTARVLAILHQKPLYAVHHLKSHAYANWLEKRLDGTPEFPALALIVSGGHTQILYMKAHNQFEIIGTTRDDAVGECFDKVAKILGLPYPGGPAISEAAKKGDALKYKLPEPKVEGLDFSFSGLKTAVLRAVQKELGLPLSFPSFELKNHLNEKQVADFAASFEETAVSILLSKLETALLMHPEVKSLIFAGGVSANRKLRERTLAKFSDGKLNKTGANSDSRRANSNGLAPKIYFPEPEFSGDNGAMVAAAAFYEIGAGTQPVDPYHLNIYPRVSIEEEG